MALTKQDKLDIYYLMKLIRRFEERCAQHYSEGDIGGFLHLYIGQEALAAGLKYGLRPDDNVITAYRDHGVALAKGLTSRSVMAEMFGKATGVSKGLGGSMHMADREKHFWGGWAIVGGHLPLAAGLALADQYRGEDRVTVCMMGDGATNIGYFHESLNLSAVWKLPVIWMIENNEYGMGTAVERASAVTDLTKKALAYDMATMKVDGMDAVAAIKGLEKAAKHCRDGNGPILVEARTYRYRGHSMGDPERYRTAEEIEERRKSDPVTRWEDTLIEEKAATKDAIARMDAAVEEEVNEAIEFSMNSPTLAKEELAHYVYA